MKNIKYFVGAICLALSLNSCSDFLNEEPVSEIPAGDMWQTARDAKAGINEIYGLLRSTLRENYFYWGEFRSDNVAPGAPVMADQARVITKAGKMLFIYDFRIGCTIHGTSLKKGMQTVLQISQKLIFHRCLYIYIIRGNTGLSRIQELPKRNTAGSQLQICAPIYNAWTFTAKLQRDRCQISAGLFHDQTDRKSVV